MKRLLCATMAVMLTAGSVTVARAEPGGCIKYGAAGAVGGHVAHHGVLGALGGCVTGMYVRHKYRKEAKVKADLYDKEHPGAKGTTAEKATAYDVEHSTQPGTLTGSPQNGTAPAGQTPAQTGGSATQM
ncbi:hypothetical protein [Acetobacter fallax]|uniref:Glycine zipper 2TM domain-containing protein n=1 Tax=Acetobacter fallax TaxID=1737473 RepID=A0ABX0K8D6_9PROT|nr:hypothetical protein [Acetobacter fallax]NHO31256.1 hypothetical protein [Acetobacter fallax]NHO34813.1 hypothetical protein [Acetobacter fallax]